MNSSFEKHHPGLAGELFPLELFICGGIFWVIFGIIFGTLFELIFGTILDALSGVLFGTIFEYS